MRQGSSCCWVAQTRGTGSRSTYKPGTYKPPSTPSASPRHRAAAPMLRPPRPSPPRCLLPPATLCVRPLPPLAATLRCQRRPVWPNSSSHIIPDVHPKVCGRSPHTGCMFNVFDDPTERRNLAAAQPARFAQMLARVDALQATVYSPVRGDNDPRACDAAISRYGGYWGPFL